MTTIAVRGAYIVHAEQVCRREVDDRECACRICIARRGIASTLCAGCSQPIGFGTPYYAAWGDDGQQQRFHARCARRAALITEAEWQR